MNKAKKEEIRKYREARVGLSREEIEMLDAADDIELHVELLARKRHVKKFPEEYDLMNDSGSEAKDRSRGINPMAADYIAEVRARRAALGVSPLSENGLATSRDSYDLCVAEARRTVHSDPDLKRPPTERCIFCEKRLEEVGGRRLTGNRGAAVFLSSKPLGGGDPLVPCRSIKLFDEPVSYLVVRGPKSLWSDALIDQAKADFQAGKRPWMCQVCGSRTCSECRTPLPAPVGSGVLYPDGSITHVGMLGVDPGCTNSACSRYREQK